MEDADPRRIRQGGEEIGDVGGLTGRKGPAQQRAHQLRVDALQIRSGPVSAAKVPCSLNHRMNGAWSR